MPINGNAFDIDGEVETATATPVSLKCSTAQHCFVLRRHSTRLPCIFLLLRLVLYLLRLLIVLRSHSRASAKDPVDFAASADPLCGPLLPSSFSMTITTTLLRTCGEAAPLLHRICHRLQSPAFVAPPASIHFLPSSSGCANARHLRPLCWSLLLSRNYSTTPQPLQPYINLQ